MPPEFVKRVMCGLKGHWLIHVRNIYGDEINYRGGKRSVWRCHNCGAVKLRDHLHQETKEPAAMPAPAPAPRCLGMDCVGDGSGCMCMRKERPHG